MATQKEIRRGIDVGTKKFDQVTPVGSWYKVGHFINDDEARGAFKLAYQQGLDGLGSTIDQWMGLSKEEYDAWNRDGSLPKAQKRRSKR